MQPASGWSCPVRGLFALILAALFVLLLPNVVQGDIQLDNTCTFGNQYIQMVGFACIEADERLRNPSWDGSQADRGRHNIKAFTLINRNMNRLGIHVANITYCSNFTVRARELELEAVATGWHCLAGAAVNSATLRFPPPHPLQV